MKPKMFSMQNWVGLRFFWLSRTIWAKSRAIDNQEKKESKNTLWGLFLGTLGDTKVAQHIKLDWFKAIPTFRVSGPSPGVKYTAWSRSRAITPPGIDFWPNMLK